MSLFLSIVGSRNKKVFSLNTTKPLLLIIGETGIELPSKTRGKVDSSEKLTPNTPPSDPQLAELLQLWPTLNDEQKLRLLQFATILSPDVQRDVV